MKYALYVPDCRELASDDDIKFVKKCLGTMWWVDEYKYTQNNPDSAIGVLNWNSMRYDLLIGKGLGGYMVMASNTAAEKIAVNPFWNIQETLGFYLVDSMTIRRWESYMPSLDSYDYGNTHVVVGSKCDFPALSYSSEFNNAFKNVMVEIPESGHSFDASIGEILANLTYV